VNPRLSLSEADRAVLAGFGICTNRDGTLSSSTGEAVDAGTAVHLLRSDREGQHPQAGQEPSGQPVGADLEAMLNRVPRTEMAKAPDPETFRRRYLKPGHQVDSPANTGGREWSAPLPESAPAEPEDFARPWLRNEHQAASPDDDPDGNNPRPPGTPGGRVYQAIGSQWRANEAKARTEHVEPSTTLASEPATARWSPPRDLRAASVPRYVSRMTGTAPGEET
jgi:hypothetical protein